MRTETFSNILAIRNTEKKEAKKRLEEIESND